MSDWFVVRAATRQERRAVSALREAGFEAYCPMVTRIDRIGRSQRRETRQHALFPGYMFVQIGDGQFAAVESADGVSGVLRYTTSSGERSPRSAPVELVEAIRFSELAGEFDKTRAVEVEAGLKVGQVVRILSGGWWGHNATIMKLDGPNRISVLLSLLGKPFEATFKAKQLEAVA